MTMGLKAGSEAVGLPSVSHGRDSRGWADRPILLRLVSILIFIGIWEIAGRIPVSFAFPTFSDTLAAFVRLMADGSMPVAYISTLQPLLLGVVLSTFLGVGLGTLCGLWRTGEWLVIPIFIVLQAAPVAAFIPMVTFVYGIGMTAKTLAVMILALPVIVLNTYKAVRNVNESLVVMGRSFLGTRWQVVDQDRPAGRKPGHLRGPPPRRGCRLRRRRAGRTTDHPDRDRRPHHLPPLARRLCRDVCNHCLDHRPFDPHACLPAVDRGSRFQA